MAAESTKSPEVEHDDNWVLLAHSRAPPGLEEAIASVQDKASTDTVKAKVGEVAYVCRVRSQFCCVSTSVLQHRLIHPPPSSVSTSVNHAILPLTPSHLHTA